jgi:hypothetical protein
MSKAFRETLRQRHGDDFAIPLQDILDDVREEA